MARNYEANPKHRAGHGNVSEMDLSDDEAYKLLNSDTAFRVDAKTYVAVYRKKHFYAFQAHRPNWYHGYQIPGAEIHKKFSEVQDQVAELLGITVKRLSRLR